MKKKNLLWLCLFFVQTFLFAQNDSTKVEEEAPPLDLSQFSGEAEVATSNLAGMKSYCSSKIFGISPTKLISIGYDYQLGFDMKANPETAGTETQSLNALHGLRLLANFPVVSKNSWTLNIGASYWESNYNFAKPDELRSPTMRSLNQSALRNAGLSFTVFKPLDAKHFILFLSNHDLNGDYRLDEFQSLSLLKHSLMGIFGWRKHDRLQFGFGAARTYRVGAMNYIPVILYNYTSENRKWGIEAVLPARANYRRTFSARSLLLVGYELEGNSYHLRNRGNVFGAGRDDLELRRSEMRLKLSYERSLYDFLWISLQAGYRYNWRNSYNVDRGDFFRSFFSSDPYAFQNTIGNNLFFNISFNLVSP